MPRVVLLTAALLGLCLAPAQAGERKLSSRERAYARALGRLLDLKPKSVKPLTSKSGARGVQVRFLGLDVTRLHFRSGQAARRFAQRRSREKAGRQRVALRGQEILVLRGARLSNQAYATRAVKAGWDASPRSPSKPSKGGLLGPLDARELEAKESEERAEAQVLAARRKRTRPAPKPSPGAKGAPGKAPRVAQEGLVTPPSVEVEVPSVATGPRQQRKIGLDAGLTPGSQAQTTPAARPARGQDLQGRWATLGPGRIVFRRTGYTKDADLYEVLCLDFERPCAPLVGSLVGRRLTLRPASGKGQAVEYLWTPAKVGGRFVRLSGSRTLLPSGTNAFWRAPN